MKHMRQVRRSGWGISRWILIAAIALAAVMAFGVRSTTAAPGILDHFDVQASVSTSAAGDSFDVTVTAKDDANAVVSGYTGTVHFTSTDTKLSTALPDDYTFVAGDNGTHTFSGGVTLTTTGSQTVSVKDTVDTSKTGVSNPIVVTPGPLDHFVLSTPAVDGEPSVPARAGHDSSVSVTAWDGFGNVKTDYSPGTAPTLSGDLNSSVSGCSGACAPIYSGTGYGVGLFTNGVASATFRPFKAESGRHLTVTDVGLGKSGTTAGPGFTVVPGEPTALKFIGQPTETEALSSTNTCQDTPFCVINSSTSPVGVRVEAKDAFGNLAYNTSVAIAIGVNPGGTGTVLGGTTPQPADANGVATFNNLTINKVGIGYTLRASAPPTSPTATSDSNAFIVAQTVTGCTGTCSPTTVTASTTLNVSASGTGSSSNSTLGIALIGSVSQPTGFCGTFQPATGSPGSFVNINSSTVTNSLMLTITWTLPKAIVNAQADNGGAHYNMCLGAVNLTDPQFLNPATKGFTVKAPTFCPTTGTTISTACPKSDVMFGVTFFWGILPDCPSAKKISMPCVASRTKDPSGNLIFKYVVPYPWDPNGYLG
jgi:hypothetical protein